MSAWRSPLLYLGFVLIVIAAAALVAPLLVDWNSYRAQFEDYGRKLTGRDVTIVGPIEARLFPWPVLVLHQVKIANNAHGTRMANLMEAKRIEMGMSLAPLISGQIEVDSIALDGPVFAFERLASGVANWSIEPERSLAAMFDPDRVAVSEVSISNGTVFAADHRRGEVARLDKFTGTLSAPALSGPWRMRATANHGGSPLEITVTTGKLKPGEAARVGLRVAPVGGAGMVYSFDGEVARREGKSVKGALKISPTLPAGGKGDAETGFRPFNVKADIEADYDTVALSNIEASPAFTSDPGNFITGAATIELGSRVVVRTALSVARLDLDYIAGPRGRELVRSGAAFEGLGHLMSAVPEGLELHADVAASSVFVGGETLDASRLKFELGPERLRIEEFTTAMPGQTRTRFSGVIVPGEGEPLMSGDLSFDSVSLRDFVVWALPEQRSAIERVWSGARGRLVLESKLDLTPRTLRLSSVRTTFDDATITGSLGFQRQPQPGLAVRLHADRVDLDRYLPRGLGEQAGESGLAMTLIDVIGQAMTLGDFEFTAQAGQLRFHGVEAQDVTIDLGASENGVEMRTVEIGRVGAARMEVAGLLRFPGEGVSGSMNALIDAQDPRGLLRLLGVFGPEGDAEPAWVKALGPLDVRLIAEASAEERITTAAMVLNGTAGGASASVEGRFHGDHARWQQGEIELVGEMEARSSTLVAAITGLQLPLDVDKPTRLTGSLSGSLSRGLATSVSAGLFGAHGQFAGTIRKAATTLEAEGRAAVLAQEAAGLLTIVGVPADSLSPLAQVISAESEIRYDAGGLQLSGLSGTAGGAAFSGDLNVMFEPVRRVSGQIATGKLSLPWLLGTVLLPRDGTPHDLSSHFATSLPGLEAELTIAADRLQMLPQIALTSSELDLRLGRDDLTLRGRGIGPGGEPATGWLSVQLDGRGVVLDGAVEGPVALGGLLQARDGSLVIDADGQVKLGFTGGGRSPAGVIAALQADGSYELPRGVLKHVDPQSFAHDLAAAKQPAEIDSLFTGSLRRGDLAFVGGSGTLKFAEGVLTTKPLAILGQGISGEARLLLEAASGEIDLSFTLALAEPKDVPTFQLAYAGRPRELELSTDVQGLRSHLSMKMLLDSVEQLEELQRQEQELIEEEENFQRELMRREQTRREEQQQREKLRREQLSGGEPVLDRKERELAMRHKSEAGVDGGREANEGLAEPFGEPPPAAARLETMTALPPITPLPNDGNAQPTPPSANHGLIDPVPVPRVKPQRRPTAASYGAVINPLRAPPKANLGPTPQAASPAPTIPQPDFKPQLGSEYAR